MGHICVVCLLFPEQMQKLEEMEKARREVEEAELAATTSTTSPGREEDGAGTVERCLINYSSPLLIRPSYTCQLEEIVFTLERWPLPTRTLNTFVAVAENLLFIVTHRAYYQRPPVLRERTFLCPVGWSFKRGSIYMIYSVVLSGATP